MYSGCNFYMYSYYPLVLHNLNLFVVANIDYSLLLQVTAIKWPAVEFLMIFYK